MTKPQRLGAMALPQSAAKSLAMARLVGLSSAALAACLFFALAHAQQGAPPAGLIGAIAATQAAKADYAFDYELDTSEQNWRARFEPAAAPRLRLLQPRREDLENEERRAFDRLAEQMEGVSWCASEGLERIAGVRLLREDAETATYAFQPTRESVRGEQARRFADRLRGEITLTKAVPDVTQLRIFAPAAFSPMPLVRVDRIDIAISCATAPNGRRYAAETVTEVRGSAFGQAFAERSTQRARNLIAPP